MGWFGHSGFIARFTGKILVALGFILGTYGLTEGQPDVMKAGLGLLIAGVISAAYGLYHQITHPLDPAIAPSHPGPAETGPCAPGPAALGSGEVLAERRSDGRAPSRDDTADQRGGPKP